MKKCFVITTCFILWVAIVGCTTIYKAAVDERNVKTIAADKKIAFTITKKYFDDEKIKVLSVSPYCFYYHVYLVGEYKTLKE